MAEPKVRFRKDDGSSYPAWTAGKLGDITEKVDRKAPKGSTAPVMMVSQGNGFIYQADKYSRENAGQSLKNYTLLKQGEFAYNHGASKAKPYGVAYCLTEEPEARVPFVYHTFRITDGVNSYWHEALNTSKMDRQLKRMVSSGARMDGLLNINYETYMDVDVNIPCIEEQQKIADFLSSVDAVIFTSEQEVANLETQKKAVMKKIFSQEVRFKRDDGSDFPDWEEKMLGDFAKRVTRKNKGNVCNLPLTISAEYGLIDQGEFFNKTVASKDMSTYYLLQNGEFAFNKSTSKDYPVGAIKRLDRYDYGAVSPLYICFALKGDDVLSDFAVQYFETDRWHQGVLDIAQEGARTHGLLNISVPGFFETVHELPTDIEEQRLIAAFLSDFDEAIAAAKKELELWKELKKGLLQQMFV